MDKIKFDDLSISMLSKFFPQQLHDVFIKDVGSNALNLDSFWPGFCIVVLSLSIKNSSQG
jgi:hypothetical protein